MEGETHCFGCDGEFEGHDGVASSNRSCFAEFAEDMSIDDEDLLKIREFYFYKYKSFDARLCWECALMSCIGVY